VAWEARATLVDLTLDSILVVAVMAGALAQIAVYGRLLWIGLGRPSEAVARGASELPRWPAPLPSRAVVGRSGMERAFERSSHLLSAILDTLWVVPAALRANRVLIAGLLVLTLSGLAFAVAAGGFGVAEAAAAVPGDVSGPTGSGPPSGETPPPSVAPTLTPPPPTESPAASESPAFSESPSPSASGAASSP
jgi:hypothetical protein